MFKLGDEVSCQIINVDKDSKDIIKHEATRS